MREMKFDNLLVNNEIICDGWYTSKLIILIFILRIKSFSNFFYKAFPPHSLFYLNENL